MKGRSAIIAATALGALVAAGCGSSGTTGIELRGSVCLIIFGAPA